MMADPTEDLFHVRVFHMDTDFPPLVQLFQEAEAVDHTGEDCSEQGVRNLLTMADHDPRRDRWVVGSPGVPGRLLASGAIWKASSADYGDIAVTVHPEWRRRGLGGVLLEKVLARAKELNAAYVLTQADVANQDAHMFLRKRGFWSDAVYVAMEAPAEVELAVPVWPEGYSACSYAAISEFTQLFQALNHGAQGLWGHRDFSAEDLRAWLTALPHDGIFLAYAANGVAVGTCQGEFSDGLSMRRGRRTGYVDSPVIVPEHRAAGLRLPLLLTTMRWLREQERTPIELESWGDTEEALALYRNLGFRTLHQAAIYRYTL